METKKQKFGRRIRFLREQAGISQSKFALMIGMNQAYLSGIENGRQNISFDNIEKIANGLGVSISDLFVEI